MDRRRFRRVAGLGLAAYVSAFAAGCWLGGLRGGLIAFYASYAVLMLVPFRVPAGRLSGVALALGRRIAPWETDPSTLGLTEDERKQFASLALLMPMLLGALLLTIGF